MAPPVKKVPDPWSTVCVEEKGGGGSGRIGSVVKSRYAAVHHTSESRSLTAEERGGGAIMYTLTKNQTFKSNATYK